MNARTLSTIGPRSALRGSAPVHPNEARRGAAKERRGWLPRARRGLHPLGLCRAAELGALFVGSSAEEEGRSREEEARLPVWGLRGLELLFSLCDQRPWLGPSGRASGPGRRGFSLSGGKGVSAQRKTAANENPPTAQSATWLLPGGQVRRTSCTSTWWLRALKEKIKMDAEPVRKFGVVVVGVGRAGSVRIRDLKNPEGSSAYLNLIGFVSRRKLGSIAEVQQIPLEDALSSQEVEVAFICSESSSHEHYIRQFLSAGKHVLVEYPMALSLAAAQELWDLAEEKGKVLHEEHIELLMEEFAFLKREVLGKELLKGSLLFTAGPLEEGQFGFPAFSGISRLTWLVSLFGELSLVSATLEEQKEKQYMKMTVHLETKDKCPLSWIEEKGPGFQRNRYLSFHFKSGSLENIPNVGVNKNIFLKDQDLFVQKLLGQVSEKELAAERKRVLHCLALADAVQRCCRAEK
ncbi:biliverdin reductase A-like isoform X2 [Dipodomys merriami]|uniref:biliverdin reductase A-like isoform X2 n=1 Tax=Dipodomys merriami TaxID=94247 RepID=UPI00384D70E3